MNSKKKETKKSKKSLYRHLYNSIHFHFLCVIKLLFIIEMGLTYIRKMCTEN
ncbi:unnamed protein product [Phytomonas sp. EM1]|nr:unnamed protein product [Phytomonas sp. EM1]|eukprot:CCW64770.1 unnamed protein product [Phytomonas sp. isolate EM1]